MARCGERLTVLVRRLRLRRRLLLLLLLPRQLAR